MLKKKAKKKKEKEKLYSPPFFFKNNKTLFLLKAVVNVMIGAKISGPKMREISHLPYYSFEA